MKLLITPGMGIGPEVSARALAEMKPAAEVRLLGDGSVIRDALDAAGIKGQFEVVDTGGGAEPAPVAAVRQAATACLVSEADAMVTGPIHKGKLIAQGFAHMGHTDMLGSIFGVDPVMAFAGGSVRVALVTTHIPLVDVDQQISPGRVRRVVEVAHAALRQELGIETPRIALCGVNPHAGEGGLIGRIEVDTLGPMANELRAEGINVVGPISAEAAFMEAARGEFDLVVAMYHDQGLVPLKVLDFGRSVNWTLGLPIVRTSVDHGTADALVGTGTADHGSMVAAIQLAMDIVSYKNTVS